MNFRNKKKLEMFSISIFFLIIQSVAMLKPADFCKISKQLCIGQMNVYYQYSEKCEQFKCKGLYSYPCTSTLCTIDKKYCDVYTTLNLLSKSFDRFKDKLYKLNKSFKECPFSTYSLEQKDVCLNGKSCIWKDHLAASSRIGNYKSFKNVTCPCVGKMSYKCGEQYCALHSLACYAVLAALNTFRFNKCGNDDFVIERKNFLYF